MPDVFYSIRPAGAGSGNDLKVACNISISSGTATLSVAQTGDIGVGCVIDFGSGNTIVYISEMTDSTHCKVVTATGGTPSDVSTPETINYIYHPFASLSAAEAGSGTLLGFTDLVTNTTNLYWPCYGATANTGSCSVSSYTMSSDYRVTIYTPQGIDAKESINNWRHEGVWSDSKFRILYTGESWGVFRLYGHAQVVGLQVKNDSTNGSYCIGIMDSAGVHIDSCIAVGAEGVHGIRFMDSASASTVIANCIISGGDSGISDNYRSAAYSVYNCVVTGCGIGIERYSATVAITNCAIFNNTDDIDGTVTATYCAGDDSDFASGTGNIQWTDGATDWAANFTDYSNGDFSVKDTDADIYHAGTDLDLDYDIAGNAWHATTPSIGAFEYAASGTEVSATVNNLTLTENSASINAEVNVNAATANLGITEYACDVATTSGNIEVSANTDTLELTENAAIVNAEINIQASADALSLTGHEANINVGTIVQADSDALTLTEHAATISYDIEIHPALVALTLATYSATINAETNVQASTDSLSISENGATVKLNVSVNGNVDALTLTEYAATINAEINVLAEKYSMAITTYNPSVSVAALATGLVSVSFTASKPGISFTGKKPSISFRAQN